MTDNKHLAGLVLNTTMFNAYLIIAFCGKFSEKPGLALFLLAGLCAFHAIMANYYYLKIGEKQ